jgi:orotate phosphoribosyltransferase
MDEYAQECRRQLRDLITEYSIRVSDTEFTLSSGDKSRVYCDLKKSVLRHEAAEPLARLVHVASSPFGPVDAYAGVALGGCHLASVSSVFSDHAVTVHVRKEPKDHGTKSLVEAPSLPPDARVVLLEDVTTSASSALRALDALRSLGHNVVLVLTVVDRRKAAEPLLDGVPFRSLFRIEEFLDEADVGLV